MREREKNDDFEASLTYKTKVSQKKKNLIKPNQRSVSEKGQVTNIKPFSLGVSFSDINEATDSEVRTTVQHMDPQKIVFSDNKCCLKAS